MDNRYNLPSHGPGAGAGAFCSGRPAQEQHQQGKVP